ncbi:MAG: glycoside hydrolase family 15 protein [Gemmatimonadales bacterium]
MPDRLIADYALIGNTHSAALVGSDGSIDWCCLPHFDSGAVFCRILDATRGGYFRIGPSGKGHARRRYTPDTAVLETDFETDGGRVRLTDFMPAPRLVQSRLEKDSHIYHRVVRIVEGLGGQVALDLAFRPTFDFARAPARLSLTQGGARAEADGAVLELRLRPTPTLTVRGDTIHARLDVEAGTRITVDLAYGDDAAGVAPAADAAALLEETRRRWNEWEALCTYRGPYGPLVRRSARVLKLLTFGPTGGLVAAPTTSLPEEIGGVRNWDYRFCWLRDSALVLSALMALGYRAAALDFFDWLDELCFAECENVQIMYRLDGSPELPERELSHLSGYRGSRPVRIGNAAAGQRQLDTYGYVLDAALLGLAYLRPVGEGLWHVLRHLAEQAATNWREPDQGIWETRGPPQQYLSSKLLCWVALDRATRFARTAGLDGDVDRWRAEAETIRHTILQDGYDPGVGAFTQALGSPRLDASALLMPLVGFLPATDERVRSTVDRIQERLTVHGLVYRYLSDDGLPGGESTFAICTFWLVDNLALQGRVDEARALFERLTGYASDLGLLAEEIEPVSGQLLGNYPQGYTHLALIRSALAIARAGPAR